MKIFVFDPFEKRNLEIECENPISEKEIKEIVFEYTLYEPISFKLGGFKDKLEDKDVLVIDSQDILVRISCSNLQKACKLGNIDLVNFMTKDNGIDACNADGVTPLMFASTYKCIKLVKWLISKDANRMVKDKNGWNAILWAKNVENNEEIVDYLENYC